MNFSDETFVLLFIIGTGITTILILGTVILFDILERSLCKLYIENTDKRIIEVIKKQ